MRKFIIFLLFHISVVVYGQNCIDVLISNQTYSTSEPIGGCSVSLENVTVDNGAKLTVNALNGVNIKGQFNLNGLGSILEIKATGIPILDNTYAASGITSNSAISGGKITYDGGSPVTIKGIRWGTSPNPDTWTSYTSDGSGVDPFTSSMTGLLPNTLYYVRAYASNSVGTGYGPEMSFTTSSMTTAALTQTAPSGGPTSVLVQYTLTLGAPSAGTKYFSVTHTNGTNTGTVTEDITVNDGATTGTLNVTYSKQASSYNVVCDFNGTQAGYTNTSSQLSYVIPALSKPTLAATTAATSITQTTAVSGGNVTNDGGTTVTERGICWSTSENPTTANPKVTSGTGPGIFSATMAGLTPSTTYWVRAYAINSAGPNYGEQISFTTKTAAALTQTAPSGGPTSVLVQYTLTLGAPAAGTKYFSVTHTNGTNTGTVTENITVNDGATTGTLNVTYSKQASSYNAVCDFNGTQVGYTNTSSQLSYAVDVIQLIPTLAATTSVSSITQTTAVSGGNVTSDGNSSITERGICWSTSPNPTTANSKVTSGTGPGSFTVTMTGLSPSTTYYVRSYAKNGVGTGYGAQTSFTTLSPVAPILSSTTTASGIDYTYATSGGVISSDGGALITAKGVCWSLSQNPVIDNNPSKTVDGTGISNFSSSVTGLSYGTTYWVRAYATNSVGTSYAPQISFTTPMAQVPRVEPTTPVTNISAVSATSGGNVTSGNGSAATARGVCWSTSSNPTIANSHTDDGTGGGPFPSSITGLSPNTTYYVRAYATNAIGTGYGDQVSFTTSSPIIATITSELTSSNSASYVVIWKVTLSAPAVNNLVIPCVTTNGTNTGTTTVNVSFSAGQTISGANAVTYTRQSGTNFTAYCSFGTMPAGYSAGSTASYFIPMLDAVIPTLASTSTVSPITCTSATSGGNITSDGGGSVMSRGLCWSTAHNPTIADSKVASGSGTGSFSATISSLTPGTTYYVRSYATNSAGTGYGSEVAYTQNITMPVIGGLSISNITYNSADVSGNISSDGCGSLASVGVCWSTSQSPTTSNSKISVNPSTGSFSGTITGLSPGTTYYVRPYATNSAGTAYGPQTSFTTLPLTTATLTQAAPSGGPTSVLVQYTLTLGAPAAGTKYFSVTHTNGSNTGSVTENITVNSGSTTGTLNVVYNKQSSSYNAVCDFNGTQAGYTNTSSQLSYLIPAAVSVPTLGSTTSVSSITQSSGTSGGNVTSDGGATVTERGICWSTSQNPTTASSKATAGSGTGSFSASMSGLSAGTTYYVRSYATNSAGTGYGSQTSFTTLSLTTASLTQASISGGPTYVAVQYTLTLGAPAVGTKYFSVTHTNGSNSGSVTENITVNSGATTGTLTITYNKQSSAYNAVCDFNGTQAGYTNTSSQLSYLIPAAVSVPTLGSTSSVSSITQSSGTSGGNVTSDGNATVTDRGICWSTSQNPTTSNSKSSSGSGTGSFSASMSGLSAGTTYYVRSYATNSAGTAYGSQVSFTTLSAGITVSISYQVFNVQPTSYVVGWFANLTSPAPSSNSIPAVITNASGTGTHAASGYVAQGQQSSIALETVTYSRLAGSSYNATCNFGTLPSGYVAGSTGVVTIPKQ